MRLCTLLLIILSLQSLPGAKAMFYDPGDRGFSAAIQPREKLRPVETRGPCLHCGIHYWLETEKGEPVTETTASGMGGKFTLHIRSVPGAFEFTRDQSPAHIVIVWALSQTEVPERRRYRLPDRTA